jgi:hypothetical protein
MSMPILRLGEGTLTNPFRTIQQAATSATAGDTIHLRAGKYREQVRPANSGTSAARITYRPYQDEAVTISGAARIQTA